MPKHASIMKLIALSVVKHQHVIDQTTSMVKWKITYVLKHQNY